MGKPPFFLICRKWYHPLTALCLLDNFAHRLGVHRLTRGRADRLCDWHDRALLRWPPPQFDWVDSDLHRETMLEKFKSLPVTWTTGALTTSPPFIKVEPSMTNTASAVSVTYTHTTWPRP